VDTHFLVFKLTLITWYVQRLGIYTQLLELDFPLEHTQHDKSPPYCGWAPQVTSPWIKDKIVSSKWSAKCKQSFKFSNPRDNNNFLAHLANVKLILIQLQLLKINKLIPQSNHYYLQPWRFNFHKVFQIFMSWTIRTRIVKPILHHMMIESKLSTCNLQCLKVFNTSTRLNTHSISIYDLEILNICLARKLTFGNWVS